jgi:PAS domain S-box-containing protein
VNIRTRVYVGLWLLAGAVVAVIAFIVVSLNIGQRADADRHRISQVITIHSQLWRAIVESRHFQEYFALTRLPGTRNRLNENRAAVDDYLARVGSLVRDPVQADRLAELQRRLSAWRAMWDEKLAESTQWNPHELLAESDAGFADINRLLIEFGEAEQAVWIEADQLLLRRRQVFFAIITALAVIGVVLLALVVSSAKRTILDPLTELTWSAHRIEQGDMTAAQQTLRQDEIGILINSFARMVLAIQAREKELAHALNETRELAHVTAEARRRVEDAHADLLATIETTPAALLIFNLDGSVRLRNRAATEVLGIEPTNPELRRNYWARFKRVAKDGSEIAPDQWVSARALRGETVSNHELEIHHPDGRVYPIIASGAPLKNELGHVTGAVVAFQDLSHLREVDRLKEEFVSIVSHELRTPLTSIRGSIQLVLGVGILSQIKRV